MTIFVLDRYNLENEMCSEEDRTKDLEIMKNPIQDKKKCDLLLKY